MYVHSSSIYGSSTGSRALALFMNLTLSVFLQVRLLGGVGKAAEGHSSAAEEASDISPAHAYTVHWCDASMYASQTIEARATFM